MGTNEKILDGYLRAASHRVKNALFLDANGLCVVKENDGQEFVVELPRGSAVVYFYSPVCRVPFDHTGEFFERVMELNLCALAYDQATFGFDKRTHHVVLSYSRPMETLDEILFTNILCNFIKTATRAKQDLAKLCETLTNRFSLTEDDVDAEIGGLLSSSKPNKLKA
jgi:hypothetical protein